MASNSIERTLSRDSRSNFSGSLSAVVLFVKISDFDALMSSNLCE